MIPDGVHLGLGNEDYHADCALGSTDLKTLLVSPADWKWAKPSNPLFEPPADEKVKEGLLLGSCLHAWVLEGEGAFWERYRLPVEEPAGLVKTRDDMLSFLAGVGVTSVCREVVTADGPAEKTYSIRSFKKDDLIALCMEHDAPLYDDWLLTQVGLVGKTQIKEKWLPVIKLIDSQVKAHPKLVPLFEAGLPEISIFWTDEGVRRKARFDWIAPGTLLDLKSLAKLRGPTVAMALKNEIERYHYQLSAACYVEASLHLPGFVEAGLVHLHPDEGTWAQADALLRLEKIAAEPIRRWEWIFAKTLDAPTIYRLPIEDVDNDYAIDRGYREVQAALANYRTWSAAKGDAAYWLSSVDVPVEDSSAGPFWPERWRYDPEILAPE